jgi:hypothetical protein
MSPGEDLLKDDRFLMFADKHWETMCDDHRYVVDAKSQVWEWLSQIAGCSDDADADLRGQAIWSSLASLAYTFRDSFERLHRLPLSLTQGDLGDNLEKLSQIDYADLTDEFSQCMRMSMELGVDSAVLEGVLRLCREAPCCTNLVEQGHGSGAATLQAHSQFGTRSLQVRSSIHQCRALFSSLPRQHLIERLDKAISKKLRAINGPRYEARCAFLLFLQNDPYHERPDDMNPSAWSKVCFAAHRERFYKLPWAQQMEFQAEADVIDMRRMSLWQDELRELQERRSSALHQLAEDLDEVASKPNLVSSHRLGIDDLHRCADVVESVRSSTTLAAMREQLLKSTEEPDPGMLQLLRGLATNFEQPSVRPPDWIRIIALNREVFYGTAVYQTIDEGGEIPNQVCLPLIALQRPYLVVWLFLELVPTRWVAHMGAPCDLEPQANVMPRFSFDLLQFSSDPTVFSDDGRELWVLEGLVFSEGSSVLAPCSPVRFRHFAKHLVNDPAPARAAKKRPRRPKAPSIREKLLDEFPWLKAADLDDDYEELDGEEKEEVGEEEDQAPDIVIGEDEYEAIRQEMLEKRAEFRIEDEDKFFYVRQRGGDSNVARIGRALDCAAMFARKGLAVQFCDKYGFPKQKSYHYTKYGGEVPANHLIREFARKGHYFCCIWVSHDCDDAFVFSREVIEGFEQDPLWLDFMCALPQESETFAQGMQIVNWQPRAKDA